MAGPGASQGPGDSHGPGPMTGPRSHAANLATLATLVRAARAGDLALLEVRERATGKIRTCLVAASRCEDGSTEFVPFALMIDGNPYDQLDPPNPDGGFLPEAP